MSLRSRLDRGAQAHAAATLEIHAERDALRFDAEPGQVSMVGSLAAVTADAARRINASRKRLAS